jgi:phenylacetyl-CoA:acceptor oxidoreductase subunit 1
MRWGMVIDLRKCVGCQTCTIACKLEHGLPPGVAWRWVADIEVGTFPDVRRTFLPLGCQHCASPPCRDVCPTTATRVREDGVVVVDYEKCIGCGCCVLACPYRARTVIHDEAWYFAGGPTAPEAATARAERVGVCTKCNFCLHRWDGDDGLRPGVDGEATPMCALSCIANAIHFGDLDDPESNVSRLIRENTTTRLMEELGLDPSVYYIVAPGGPGPAPAAAPGAASAPSYGTGTGTVEN